MESHECLTPESRVCKDCGTEKPITEFYRKGNTGRFFTSCKDCCKARDKTNYLKQKEGKLAKCAEYRESNKDRIKQYMADYYQKNKEVVLQRCNEYRSRQDVRERELERQKTYYAARSAEIQARRAAVMAANPERKSRMAEYQKQHYEANGPLYAARVAKRRAVKCSSTPAWANLKAIKRIYQMCARVSQETGVQHHVDHVIPLQGKRVCGLHVEHNLQIIPATDNRKKSNKLEG